MTPKLPNRAVRLNEIQEMTRLNCKIKDVNYVENIINELIKGGNNELQIVTDFDFTLTKQVLHDGKPVHSSFGMFNQCKSIPKSFIEESDKLYKKYRPIEICPQMSQMEKRNRMVDWWTSSANLLK